MTVGQRVAKARKYQRPSMTQVQLAALLGLNRTVLAKRESESRFEPAHIEQIAQILNVSEEWLLHGGDTRPPVGTLSPAGSPDNQGDDQTPITLSDGRRVRFSRMIKVPIVGVVSAGPGVDELIEGDEIWVPNSMVVGIEEPFAQLVEGDSMLPWLRPGDVVVAKPLRQERLGYAFIVRSADGQVRVKQLIYDQNEWRFRSINRDKYPDEPARDQLVGLVVGRYRFEDGEETTVFNPRGLKPRRDLFE